jgi:hypothetical protein
VIVSPLSVTNAASPWTNRSPNWASPIRLRSLSPSGEPSPSKLRGSRRNRSWRIAPTWLLLDLVWASIRAGGAVHCSVLGRHGRCRVKWIEGSKHTGKDNYVGFGFDAMHTNGPVFHWPDRGKTMPTHVRICEQCGRSYERECLSARFCSQASRQSAYRTRLSVTLDVTHTPTPNGRD